MPVDLLSLLQAVLNYLVNVLLHRLVIVLLRVRQNDFLSSKLDHLLHLLGIDLIWIVCLRVELPLLHDQVVYFQLSCGSLNNLLFNRALGHQTIDHNLSLLPYSVSSINGLQVDLWVPVRVEDDDNVCGVQVDSEAASPRGKNEELLVRLRILKIVNPFLSIVS